MAKPKSKKPSVEQTTGNGIPELPEGFELVTQADGIQTWYRPKIGKVVFGRLLGRFERKSGRAQAFYQVKLYHPCEGIQGRGDDAEVVELQKGDVLNVNETSALEELHALAASDGIFDVHITPLEKVDLPNGNTFWCMRIGKKTVRAATSIPDVSKAQKGNDEYEDIPF